MYRITREFSFDAAHHIEGHRGRCHSPHGHRWVVQVTVEGKVLDNLGMLCDFSVLKANIGSMLDDHFEHKDLNTVFKFVPTAENIAEFIYMYTCTRLRSEFINLNIKVCSVKVWETPTSCAEYVPDSD